MWVLCSETLLPVKKSKRGDANMTPHPRKTSWAARVAPQRCPILHMSKSKIMIPIIMEGVKGSDWPFAPWRWPSFAATVALKVRATGIFSPLFVLRLGFECWRGNISIYIIREVFYFFNRDKFKVKQCIHNKKPRTIHIILRCFFEYSIFIDGRFWQWHSAWIDLLLFPHNMCVLRQSHFSQEVVK